MKMFRILAAVAVIVLSVNSAFAATKTWINLASPGNGDWNYAGTNWNPGAASFAVGDTAQFIGGSGVATQNIFVGTAGVPANITIGGLTIFGGYGTTYNFSGGDIQGPTASVNMSQDNTGNFYRDASYLFGGGTNVNQANSSGNIRFSPPTATGPIQFGTGAIKIGGNGRFYFEPGAVGAVLNNNFTVAAGGGTLSGNTKAAFNGTVTMNASSGALSLSGRNIFSGLTFNVTGNPVIDIPVHYDSNSWGKFDGQINGGGVADVTIRTGGAGSPTDYYGELTGAGGWNVKNVNFTGASGITIVPNSATYFSGVAANGGKVYVQEGIVAPSTGNNGNGTSKTGTYNVSVDHVVNAQLRAATINVNSGATVYGTGLLYTNLVDVKTGGALAPGQSAGTLNVNGGINLRSGSSLEIEIGGLTVGTQYDRVAATGSAIIGSALDVSFINGFENLISSSDTFTILTASGVTGSFSNLIDGRVAVGGLGTFLVTFNSNNITLSNFQLPPAPEPSTAMLLGLGMIGLVARQRRKSRG
jgi:fibronectin-binding autotransporter adhesin